MQAEGAYKLGDRHTVRAGLIFENDRSNSATTGQAFLADTNVNEPHLRSGAPRQHPRDHRRRWFGQRPDLQRLPPGRVEGLRQFRPELWPALRSAGFLPEGEPAEPAGQLRLDPAAGHHDPRRLFPLFHPAAVRAGQQRDAVQVLRHGQLSVCLGGQSEPEARHDALFRARQLLRSRRAAEADPRLDHRRRRLLPHRQEPDRRRPVRRGDHPDAVQLPVRQDPRRRPDRELQQGAVQRLLERRLRARNGRGHRVQPVQFRPGRAGLHRPPLHLPGPQRDLVLVVRRGLPLA